MALIAVAYFMTSRRGIRIPLPFVVIALGMVFCFVFVWDTSNLHLAGFTHYIGAFLFWAIGFELSKGLDPHSSRAVIWPKLIVSFLVIQLGVSVLELVGIPLPGIVSGTTREVENGRIFGTVGNSGTLGKIAFLILIVLLPFAMSKTRNVRAWGLTGVLLAVVLTALTLGRANMAAVLILILGSLLFASSSLGIGRRVLLLGALVIAAFIFGDAFLQRFLDDPEGTIRPQLSLAAFEQMSQTLWQGVGPNSYVEVVGSWDITTARGFPVHNAFLLAIAELGLVLGVILFVPFAKVAWRAARGVVVSSDQSGFARTLLFACPGLVIVLATGWGMLNGFMLCLFMFIFGILDRQLRPQKHMGETARRKAEHQGETQGSLRA
ncbi:hypothetical protein GCM10027416_08090 [Okibacterium endophyticum]